MKQALDNTTEYKQTELGLLPKEWEVVRLGESVLEVKTGDWGKDNNVTEGVESYVIRGTDFLNVLRAKFDNIPVRRIQEKSLKLRCLKVGEVLIELSGGSKDQPTGRILIITQKIINSASKPLCFSNFVKKLHLKPNVDAEFFYLFWQYLYNKGVTKIYEKRTTGIRNFKLTDFLGNEYILLPPLSEQKAIAAVLSAIQEAKEKTEAVITATKELKKSMMKHLFTYGPVSPKEKDKVELKQTDIGMIPKEWEVVRLGDVAEVKYGKATPKDEGKIPVVGSGGIFSYTSMPLLKEPTIIIGRKGTAGKAWLMLEPCYPSDTTFYLVLKKNIDLSFLFSFIISNPLSGEHAKTTLPSLQRHELENFQIPLPPLPIQQKIASILSAIDAKIEAEVNKKKALEALFKSMLHHLMTGKVRVNHLINMMIKKEA